MQCDNGKEFDKHSLRHSCISNGITFRFSYSYTSSQKEKVKRKIRIINNIIHNLLSHASISSSFWSHSLQMVTYLLNILPSSTQNFLTLLNFFIIYHKSSYHDLHFFSCLYFPLIPTPSRHKLQARSTPSIFLRYPSNHRGYTCFDLLNNKIFISRSCFI